MTQLDLFDCIPASAAAGSSCHVRVSTLDGRVWLERMVTPSTGQLPLMVEVPSAESELMLHVRLSNGEETESLVLLAPPSVARPARPSVSLPSVVLTGSFALGGDSPGSAYEAAKYGRITADSRAAFAIGGEPFDVMLKAVHIPHHMLAYTAGVTFDVNNDGLARFTAGASLFRTGQKRSEPFVTAPYFMLRLATSRDKIFGYGEIEAVAHERAYMSGTVGLGYPILTGVGLILAFHHSEFNMMSEAETVQVNGPHLLLTIEP